MNCVLRTDKHESTSLYSYEVIIFGNCTRIPRDELADPPKSRTAYNTVDVFNSRLNKKFTRPYVIKRRIGYNIYELENDIELGNSVRSCVVTPSE